MASAYVSFLVGWVVISTPLHLAWEIGQVRFYTLWQEAGAGTLVYSLLHCTAGDALIAAATFLIAALVTRRHDWPQRAWRLGLPVLLAAGLGYTTASEWVNVYRLQRWAYTADMPLLAGIGAMPLAQWLVVPLAAFWIHRRAYSSRFTVHRIHSTKEN